MASNSPHSARPRLTGRRVLVPGGTGGVGEGVVRGYPAADAGAGAVAAHRSQRRAEEFRHVLGEAATGHLHLVAHDYTTFDGAERLAAEMADRLGGPDDVVAPMGGFRAASGCGRSTWQTGRVPLPGWRPRPWPSCGPACRDWGRPAPTA